MTTTATRGPQKTGGLRSRFSGGGLRQYGMMIALGALMLLFEILTNGLFLQPRNVTCLVYTSPSPRD